MFSAALAPEDRSFWSQGPANRSLITLHSECVVARHLTRRRTGVCHKSASAWWVFLHLPSGQSRSSTLKITPFFEDANLFNPYISGRWIWRACSYDIRIWLSWSWLDLTPATQETTCSNNKQHVYEGPLATIQINMDSMRCRLGIGSTSLCSPLIATSLKVGDWTFKKCSKHQTFGGFLK